MADEDNPVVRGPNDDPNLSDAELVAQRRAWFDSYTSMQNVVAKSDGPCKCPCCGCLTLDQRGGYDICPVCFWEDDGQDDHDADVVRGGPNKGLSLTVARANFRQIGASDERYLGKARPPLPNELPG